MMEGTKVQARERERDKSGDAMEVFWFRHDGARHERAQTGKVVIKPSDREWGEGRNGRHLPYLLFDHYDTAVQDWGVWIHNIRTQSGVHTHQGGIALFVLEGKGATVMDGERYEWEKGDVILLPMKVGGIEHQHFNFTSDGSTMWLGFVHNSVWNSVASEQVQLQDRKEWIESRLDAAG